MGNVRFKMRRNPDGGVYLKRTQQMFAKWTDDMVRDYFDTHWNATLHEISALSGRTKADVKRVLMEG
ncbi:MAG: hypothetical protein GY820_06730 [Gammaproteobacteria bacterium]|nr:hypothetical protein [Gammaproteobacteria bacterium]